MIRPALLALALATLTPSTADAQIPSFGAEDCNTRCSVAWVGGVAGGTILAATEVVLIVDGIIKAGHGHGLYEFGAGLEVAIGLAHLVPVAIATWALLRDYEPYVVDGETRQDSPEVGFVALGLASSAFALYFFSHGLWSLTGGAPPASHFVIGLAPSPDGATFLLGGAL